MKTPPNTPRRKPRLPRRHQQEGVVLIVALIALVVVTMVTLATMRNTTMEERMAGASRDRNKAFQAAEYALRECLAPLKDGTYASNPIPAALDSAVAPDPPVWEVATNWAGTISREITVQGIEETDLAAWPRCLFEKLGDGTGSFRVTARALGASDTTAVILQATFSTQ